MSKKFFSPSRRAFFAEEFMDAYIENGTCPDDLVELDEDVYLKYSESPPRLMELGAGDDGFPTWVKTQYEEVELSIIKSNAIARINSSFKVRLDRLTSEYPSAEVSTFDRQEREAITYKQTQDPNDVPLISAIAEGRGVTIETLVDKVIAKASEYSVQIGALAGKRQRLVSMIEGAETREEVKAIKWED